MKRRLLPQLIAALLAIGCNNNTEKSDNTTTVNEDQPPVNATIAMADLLGSFVGSFGTNKITLLITKVTADSVEGRSVVGGNDRPFIGTVSSQNNIYSFIAKEPGDDQHDGTFEFKIDIKNPNKVEGSWAPNKATETITPKTYSLERKNFAYTTNVGEFPEASQRLLKDKDVNNLLKYELELMRNEIFARHGYCFKKKDLREQFEDKDWYVPHTVDVRGDLTEIEKQNIALIKKYEKYADQYGDDYGR